MATLKVPDSFPDSKLITCVLPDNGTDLTLVKSLRAEKGIITANSFACRGVEGSSTGKKKLEVKAVRVVAVVVVAELADEIFEYIYDKAGINQDEGGFMYQSDLVGATPFVLPEGIPDEVGD